MRATRRYRSVWVPTAPTVQAEGPFGVTVSTRMGSLKSWPVRIWPSRIGSPRLMAIPQVLAGSAEYIEDEHAVEGTPIGSGSRDPCGGEKRERACTAR